MSTAEPIRDLYDSAVGNPAWVEKLMSGDAGARSVFDSMMRHQAGLPPEPPPAGAAEVLSGPVTGGVDLFAPDAAERLPGVAGIVGPFGVSDREKLGMINTLRDAGQSEGAIREAFDPERSYSREMHDLARQKWLDLSSDPDFRRRLFDGDAVAARQWRAFAIIESGGVKG